jgi:hypothetical protein
MVVEGCLWLRGEEWNVMVEAEKEKNDQIKGVLDEGLDARWLRQAAAGR